MVPPANEQDRPQVGELDRQVQEVTNQSVELAFVDEFPFPFVRVASDVSCDLLRQHFFVIPDAS